jgi:DNA replication and repair protein RecF
VHVSHLALVDFRSYETADIELRAGSSVFLGPNGQGKTNLVEAVHYAATQSSHRVASDQPLVRLGADQAIVRVRVQRDDRTALIELELNPGRANRARLNQGAVPRARDVLGILRTVVFSPDDLDLIRGDPTLRRRFLDDLLTIRQPRFAGVRADYDRVLKQRNTLLKTAGGRRTGARNPGALATLESWDAQLARTGAELLAARLALVADLDAPTADRYAAVSQSVPKPDRGDLASLAYRASWELAEATTREDLEKGLLAELENRRDEELDRGVTLVGPHRDDLVLSLGPMPAKGYASHGESWSFALALRLASFELLRADGDVPVLVLDDVFAELDALRRARLAEIVGGTEQVLVTAAVPDDVPTELVQHRFDVRDGTVTDVS